MGHIVGDTITPEEKALWRRNFRLGALMDIECVMEKAFDKYGCDKPHLVIADLDAYIYEEKQKIFDEVEKAKEVKQ